MMVFWVVTPCSNVIGSSPRRWKWHGPPKRYSTSLYDVTTHRQWEPQISLEDRVS